jgi:hypothetical protein
MKNNADKPLPEEVAEAKRNPNGFVYRIAGNYGPNDNVPPEAIIGAWKVDGCGCIIGEFVANRRYKRHEKRENLSE